MRSLTRPMLACGLRGHQQFAMLPSTSGRRAAAALPSTRHFSTSLPSLKVSQETMKAIKVHGPLDYRLETVPVPKPKPGELLMKVEATGVCASDLKAYHGSAKFWGVEGDPNRPPWIQKGVTPGHEIVGVIAEGDPDTLATRGLKEGDRVTVEQIVPCKTCRYCKSGDYHMCKVHNMFGFNEFDGGMAEYMLVPSRALVHKISPKLHPYHAAFVEPLSCSLHAVERADLKFNDTVVVAGCGPLGLGCVVGAVTKGALNVIALDMNNDKLALAKKMGANYTFNIKEVNAIEEVKKLTNGDGCDVYVEATGHPSAVTQGLSMLRKLGTFLEYSVFKEPVSCDWSIISDDKALTVKGAHLGPHCWPQAIKLIEKGNMPMEEVCTHQFPLENFQDALNLVADSTGNSVKVSIVPALKA